jgi:hypothetical protein
MTDIPQWALDKAAKAAGVGIAYHGSAFTTITNASIAAHARTLAKYEKPPVDPDLERARELLAIEFERLGNQNAADWTRKGEYDTDAETLAVMAALKEGRG